MLFNSYTFLLFFCCVFSIYLLLPTWVAQKRLLLVASYLFYAAWYAPYVGILFLSTAVDWWIARRIDRCQLPSRRRHLLWISLICNLGLLGFFKYGGFFLDNAYLALSRFGLTHQPHAWDIVLPIGISFYTFASLSYTIDVYRREVRGDWGFLDYALFVSFFPHLVAGPIVRARMLLPQIAEPRRPSIHLIAWGLTLACVGLFSKVVLADYVFAPVVEQVYAQAAKASALDAWAAVLGFSGQIYFDFSGYSLCAIGLALCFGFEFPDNFRYPYGARGFSDFWRRWHITLSTWLRDYLYIPLGGSFHGPARTYANLMITMLLGGLWHGASWMFVLWGGLHGTYLAAERWLRERGIWSLHRSGEATLGPTSIVFLIITLTWIPFRAPNVTAAWRILADMARFHAPHVVPVRSLAQAYTAVALMFCWHVYQRDSSLETWFMRRSRATRIVLIGLCLIAMFLCSGGDERAFIYFQF